MERLISVICKVDGESDGVDVHMVDGDEQLNIADKIMQLALPHFCSPIHTVRNQVGLGEW